MGRRGRRASVDRDDCPACGGRKRIGDAVCVTCVLLVPGAIKQEWFRVKGERSVWWLDRQRARNAVVEAARQAIAEGRKAPAIGEAR